MKNKLFSRLICACLAVLMVVCVLPVISVGAADDEEQTIDYTTIAYANEEERLAAMKKFYDNGEYALYCDEMLGIVAYQKVATKEVLFTNPWNMNAEKNMDENVRSELMSQILMDYVNSENVKITLRSFTDAALKGQIKVKSIKNGLRVEYSIGELSSRALCPKRIEKTAFDEKILAPMQEAVKAGKMTARQFDRFKAFFNLQNYTTANENKKKAIALTYPVCETKNIDIYVFDPNASTKQLREEEALIMQYCPEYSFEVMDNDYDFVEYQEEAISPPVFKMALEYTVDSNGLRVTLPANGLRYDETAYRITRFQILPYMGASQKKNDGYSFIPDGSGTLYQLSTPTITNTRVYGEDYALFSEVAGFRNEVIRMPIFGQVETLFYPDEITPGVYDPNGVELVPPVYSETEGKRIKRGYLAIIEEGDSLASIAPSHTSYMDYTSIIPTFFTRQSDTSDSGWSVYASRRYTDDYQIRYILLSDDEKAAAAKLPSYYECTWMGMACAYRDYLENTVESFDRLTEEEVGSSIPLYIETFGCVDTTKKVMSMPVTVSVPLTSFEDIATMYDYLLGNEIENVNFKLTGYANGGLYSDVPYKLKWEKSVGGKSDFKDLAEYAKEQGFGVFPDFDFVYTTQGDGGNAVNMKKNASRTIDNRYTTKRVYSATQQSLVSYYQMVLSPATYSKFYEKLEKKYSRYKDINNISLSTLGSDLNSDYDEDKSTLREEAKEFVVEALSYFKDKDYNIMVDGGNAYTWGYANHILDVSLDSSRYNAEYRSVPFMGVVLHGYVQFAGSALNMEGNLSYAMLKAMENGASLYFILSYANTELLKEDIVLSQNYSVRYDIWQNRLVELYKELNDVLGDVQTKLIIDHQFLDGSRVPEEKELLQDIADEMAQKAKELEEKIEAERLEEIKTIRKASDTVYKTIATMESLATATAEYVQMMSAQRFAIDAETELKKAWDEYETQKALDPSSTATEKALGMLESRIRSYFSGSMARLFVNRQDANLRLGEAKAAYELLKSVNANEQVLAKAKADLGSAIDNYLTLFGAYYGTTVTLATADRDTFINDSTATVETMFTKIVKAAEGTPVQSADLENFFFGTDSMSGKYTVLGAEQLDKALVDLLTAKGFYDATNPEDSLINYKELYEKELNAITTVPEEDDSGAETPEETPGAGPGLDEEDIVIPDPPKSKYSMDNGLVLVTYGEKGSPYKSVVLNFNDYTVQTEVGGVTYTIAGYQYIVIKH